METVPASKSPRPPGRERSRSKDATHTSARASRARDPPKKAGAGRRTRWGKPGDELEEAPVDRADPCYDSSEEVDQAEMLASMEAEAARAAEEATSPPTSTYDPSYWRRREVPSLATFKARVATVIKEYFLSEDVGEAVRCGAAGAGRRRRSGRGAACGRVSDGVGAQVLPGAELPAVAL